ncbi:MAG: sialate O-acetylesterase, partial [Bacteroidota bacterium]
EQVKIIPSWSQQLSETKADSHASWSTTFQTPPAGGPYSLTIVGSNTIVIKDILIGEVWLASGQSNMEWSAKSGIDRATEEILNANHPMIRFFDVANQSALSPQLDVEGTWTACTNESMSTFSAVGYFFARRLQEKLNIPIGIVHSSWGGTPAEAWTHPQRIEADPKLKAAAAQQKPRPWCPHETGSTYFSMLRPLVPFRIAGVIWYQGESNVNTAEVYPLTFRTMIENWRADWGYEFPFYYVQIAPYKYELKAAGAQLREAQRQTLQVPNTGMVVIHDIGNIDDIHPQNKQDVGLRLANLALHKNYGQKDIIASGPTFVKLQQEGQQLRVHFEHTDGGLVCEGAALSHFEIAGADQQFVPAKASIEGNTVLLRSEAVHKPVAVRFGWSNTATPNLFNGAGLPASTFRAGLE